MNIGPFIFYETSIWGSSYIYTSHEFNIQLAGLTFGELNYLALETLTDVLSLLFFSLFLPSLLVGSNMDSVERPCLMRRASITK